MKKIAVCLSGCPRGYKTFHKRNEEFWEKYKEFLGEEIQLYYFLSYWEFIAPGGPVIDSFKDRLLGSGKWTEEDFDRDSKSAKINRFLSNDEIGNVAWTIGCVDANYHTWEEYRKVISFSRNNTKKRDEVWWESPAYLMRDSLNLKRKYEHAYGNFDMCLWTRLDVTLYMNAYMSPQILLPENSINVLPLFVGDVGFSYTGITDTVFFGDSKVMDYVAEIYPAGNLPFNYPPVPEKNGYTVVEQIFRDALDYDHIRYRLLPRSQMSWEIDRTSCEDYLKSYLISDNIV